MRKTAINIWLSTIMLAVYCALIVLGLVEFWVVALFALFHTITLWLVTTGFEHLAQKSEVTQERSTSDDK